MALRDIALGSYELARGARKQVCLECQLFSRILFTPYIRVGTGTEQDSCPIRGRCSNKKRGVKRMARCPECGSWIWHPRKWFEEHVCPNCGAILKLKANLGGFFLGSLEVVGRAANGREESSPRPIESLPRNLQRNLGEDSVQEDEEIPSSGEDLASSGRCEYCHAVITPPNARFCANCRASLSCRCQKYMHWGEGKQ
jgi:predicted RNA-binding Zn-ribbon protein involved in translation (DUF1610 family)